MSFIRGFAAFWYDFIVGDSWELAAGVVGLLALAKLIDVVAPEFAEQTLFVLVPAAVVATLSVSLARAER
jgi:hypothetical protein